MASLATAFGQRARGGKRKPLTLFLYFLVVPAMISIFETLLQFPVTSKGNIFLSLGFAMAFTVPGTLFAWGTTMVLARVPGALAVNRLLLLAAGYFVSIIIFSPYNWLVYEAASRALPHMREINALREHSSIWQQVSVFLLTNVPAVLIWTALNLVFMARFDFPNFGRGNVGHETGKPATADAAVPDFCRAAAMGELSQLWSISAEEHYLRLIGTFGVRVIRHPFHSALEQLAPEHGVQVHRSHWVAFGCVERIDAAKDVQLVLRDGTRIPVSKSYRRAVRLMEASLLAV